MGLFRHWWVIVKLALTLLSTLVHVAYTTTLTTLADAARDPVGHLGLMPSASPVIHSGAAVDVLLAAAALSVFKPKGLTHHGWRKQQEEQLSRERQANPRCRPARGAVSRPFSQAPCTIDHHELLTDRAC